MFTHKLESARRLWFKLRYQKWTSLKSEVTGSHVHFKSGSVLKTVLDKDVETTVHKQEVISRTAI